ncbi:HipA N-terminal domain-containing protein [Dyadobacter pollutisoli]|uniref:HipA N-terminal domain-containing protein n=1 Tax=Dyadobacter pollutisoli TaxID=2910158 RepID=A0A9E8NDG2_9BACT|nr:HipA N-terminal domain-containing protein [Dyadobacter pollutisoli]WAC13288.1 HipA N-terminal domain-containing protein [Dyadobacter pollutisoli]
MIRKAHIYNNDVLAGTLIKTGRQQYTFRYEDSYLEDPNCFAISLSFPKVQQAYASKVLFPFFYGLLSEGVNKQTQCRLLRIDENDHFSLLLATAKSDTIGSITVREVL